MDIQEQEQFQNNDLVNDGVIPFTDIYDNGYRAKMVAWRAGKQRVLQPVWAEVTVVSGQMKLYSQRQLQRTGVLTKEQ